MKKLLVLIPALLLGLSLLAACSSGSTSPPAVNNNQSTATTQAAPATTNPPTTTTISPTTTTPPTTAATFTLTMAATGTGTVSPASGGHSYAQGTVVNISATAGTGYQFTSWVGTVVDPKSASTTVTMNLTQTITANFSQIVVPPATTPPPTTEPICGDDS